VFDVRPADIPYIVSLQDVKEQLNMVAGASDAELRTYLEAATGVVERHLGQAVVRRQRTEEHNVRGALILNWSPVVALVSVARVDGSHTWDVSELHVSSAGVVTSLGGSSLVGLVSATYVAGMGIVPGEYGLAGRIIVQHLWETQRGSKGAVRPGGMSDSMAPAGRGYAIPNRALELLGSGMPGFA
jgi:hypothetical protein